MVALVLVKDVCTHDGWLLTYNARACRETMNTPNVMGRALSRWRLLAAVVMIVFALGTLLLFSVGDSRGGEKAWATYLCLCRCRCLCAAVSASAYVCLCALCFSPDTRVQMARARKCAQAQNTRAQTRKKN